MVLRDTATAANAPTAGSATHTAAAMQRIRRQPRQADRDPVGRARKRRIIELSLGITFPVALLVLWQIAGTQGWISRFNYPPPSDIAKEINRSFRANPKGNWWIDVYWSAERMLFGYMWGVFIGVFLGVTMGMNRLLRATLEPTLNALYTVPKIALIGVFLVTLGFTNRPVIAIVTITVFFFVWIQTMAAVMAVSENYREAAASFGSNRWQMFRHVMLPASLPQIFVGLRVAAGVAVLTIIGVEFVFAPGQKGIGYRIVNARQTLDPKQAYVGLFVAAVFGVIFVTVIKFLDWLLLPWARDDNSLD